MKLPTAPAKYDPADQSRMRGAIEQDALTNLKAGAAISALYLTATDNGATMKLTVNSSGTMTWTQVTRT